MRVRMITLTSGGNVIGQYSPETREDLIDFFQGDFNEDEFLGRVQKETKTLLNQFKTGEGNRITFAGYVTAGKSGITLSWKNGALLVSGHKIDEIPEEATSQFHVFDRDGVDEAFKSALIGMPTMVELDGHSFAMRWDPFMLEVYGIGEDSA